MHLLKKTVAKILIAQAPTANLATTYHRLKKEYKVDIAFQAFTKLNFIPLPLFRTYKPLIRQHSAFVFTNKPAMDGFFKFSKICNIAFPASTKYFCATERLQNYLQKYIEIKKRKLFHGRRKIEDLFSTIPKHKNETFLFPCSSKGKESLRTFFAKRGYHYTELVFYENAYCDLSELDTTLYDIIVFFNPLAVASFLHQFPNYDFGKTKLAAYGEKTIQALSEKGYPIAIQAPTPETPSIFNALDDYLKNLYEYDPRIEVKPEKKNLPKLSVQAL